jgi:hypothetical protein
MITLIDCASSNYKLIGITSKEKEVKYFGLQFAVSLTDVDKDSLQKIKLDLKNYYATTQVAEPEKFWDEISNLSADKYDFLIFQILPETRVFPEFLKFDFILNEEIKPSKVYLYYIENKETITQSRYYYPGIGPMGGLFYPPPITSQTDIKIKLIHNYSYLILKPKNLKVLKLRAITAKGNFIDFEKEN